MNMLSGIVILDEKDLYSPPELGTLILYSVICIVGIVIIAKKPSCKCRRNKNKILRILEAHDQEV